MIIKKHTQGVEYEINSNKDSNLLASSSGSHFVDPNFNINDFKISPIYNESDLDEGTIEKSFMEVLETENFLIQITHSPYGIQRRFIKKRINEKDLKETYIRSKTDNSNYNYNYDNQYNNVISSINYDNFDLNKKIHPKMLEYNEEQIRNRCKDYFHKVRGTHIQFNENGGNTLYDDTELRNLINTKIDLDRLFRELVPVRQWGTILHGRALHVDNIHSFTPTIISRISYPWNVGLKTLTSGGWRDNVTVEDSGGVRSIIVGNLASRLVLLGNEKPLVTNQLYQSRFLIKQQLFWRVAWAGHGKPGHGHHNYPVEREAYVVTDMDHGSESDRHGENYAIHKFIKGHAGHSVGVDYAMDPEVAVLYNGDNTFHFGADRGSDMLLKLGLVR